MPASALYFSTRYATAGVGTTPRVRTLAPMLQSPAAMAFSSISEDRRVSLPISTRGCRFDLFVSTCAAARPSWVASSQVRSLFAMPRMPSVPKSLPIKKHLRFLKNFIL